MLIDASPTTFSAIYMVSGYVDLRKNIDGLAGLLMTKYDCYPYTEKVLYLFCGRCAYKIKGLVWEKNGFLLLYKRLKESRFKWERNESKGLIRITYEEFLRLMTEGSID